jgi:hypothetical protein
VEDEEGAIFNVAAVTIDFVGSQDFRNSRSETLGYEDEFLKLNTIKIWCL